MYLMINICSLEIIFRVVVDVINRLGFFAGGCHCAWFLLVLVSKVLDERPEGLRSVPNSSLDMLHDLGMVTAPSLHSFNLSLVFRFYLSSLTVYLLDWGLWH